MSDLPQVPCSQCRRPLPPIKDPTTRFVDCPDCKTRNDLASGATLVGAGGTAAPTPQSAGPTTEAELQGKLLGGRYRLDVLIGRGGMGSVFRGTQVSLNRTVAVKLLGDHLLRDRLFVERFRREAEILATFDHPHIVQVIDTDVDASTNQHYIVMQYVAGADGRPRSLKDLLEGGEAGLQQTLRILTQSCAALHYAHAKGIIHRDIKPGNILVDPEGNARLADFGIASTKSGGSDSALTLAGEAMGTPDYMSPEQRADPTKVTPRSDIYSLGVILYEILTGVLPRGERYPQPSRVRDGLDPRLDEIVAETLQKDPAKRIPSAEALRHRLEGVMGTPPPPPKPAPPPRRPEPPRVSPGVAPGRVQRELPGISNADESPGVGRADGEPGVSPAMPYVSKADPSPWRIGRLIRRGLLVLLVLWIGVAIVAKFLRDNETREPAAAPMNPAPAPVAKTEVAPPAAPPQPSPTATPAAFGVALSRGDEAGVSVALRTQPELRDQPLPDGSTPLHLAVAGGQVKLMELFKGTNLEARDRRGDTPLLLAARLGQEPALRKLVEWKADTKAVAGDGKTALALAKARPMSAEVIRLLGGADEAPATAPAATATPAVAAAPTLADLLAAIDKGDDARVRQLLTTRPVLHSAVSADGSTPIHRAAAKGRVPAIAMLIAVGADVNAPRHDGDRPLHTAVREIQVDSVKELLRRGANPRLAGAKGQSSEKIATESWAGQEIIDLIRRPALAGAPTPLPVMTAPPPPAAPNSEPPQER